MTLDHGHASRYLREALDRRATDLEDDTWLEEYRDRPLDFAGDVLGLRHPESGLVTLWAAQRWIAETLARHRYVAVASCRGSGKSHLAALAVAHFFFTRPARVLILAPTIDQAVGVVFAKFAGAVKGATRKLPGTLRRERFELDREHFVSAVPTRDPDRVRGVHAGVVVPPDPDAPSSPEELERILERERKRAEVAGDELLIVVDEAPSVPEATFRVLEGQLAKPGARILALGNPTLGLADPHTFTRAFTREDPRWRTCKIAALSDDEAEELGAAPDPLTYDASFVVPGWLLPRENVEAQLAGWELDDPVIASDVLGRFSTGSTSSLVIPRWVLDGALEAPMHEQAKELGPSVGIDPGGVGDSTVLAFVFNGELRDLVEWRLEREDAAGLVTSATRVLEHVERWGRELESKGEWEGGIDGGRVHVDASGLGGLDQVLASRGLRVDAVQFGGRASGAWAELVEGVAFPNARCEMLWTLRRMLIEKMARIPREPRFRPVWRQAAAVGFERTMGPDGPVIRVEAKDGIRKRLGRSPDHLDAVALACAREPAGVIGGRVFASLRPRSADEWNALRGERVRWTPVWREGDGRSLGDALADLR